MSDLTFFTNEPGSTLLDRFKKNLNTTPFLYILVGYFYTSGFHSLYKSLENTEKLEFLLESQLIKKIVEFIETSRQLQKLFYLTQFSQ